MNAHNEAQVARLRRLLASERDWMKGCGENLSGYIARYGSVNDPDHYGDGAEAIYQADLNKVKSLELQIESLTGKKA